MKNLPRIIVVIISLLFCVQLLFSHPDDIYWSNDFGIPSTDEVRAILVDGPDIYYNEFAGLVKWNLQTKEYKVLGLSAIGTINVIVKHDNYIYIGGSFENFGGSDAKFIARWDGTKWEKVVDGIDGKVNTICFDDDDNLWIGGMFKNVAGISSPNIAFRKNGVWQEISELNNQVRTIINVKGEIYVGGDFYFEDKLTENITCVVKWNKDHWQPAGALGNQCGSRVFTLISDTEGRIFAGGMFFRNGDDNISQNVAMYDGNTWLDVGAGFDNMVFVLEYHNGLLYAGGYFDKSGDNECKKIAVFDGTQWKNIAGGFEGDNYPTVLALVSSNNEYLYCGGNFNKAGSIDNWGFVRLNPNNKWENFLPAIRNGAVGGVLCLTVEKTNNILYAGGGMVKTGKIVSYGIAKFNGTEWQGCNDGLTPTSNVVYSMQAVNDTVYFTGWYNYADGIRLRNVAKWLDPQQTWEAVGNGIYGNDHDLGPICVIGKDIYVGGNFKTVENGSDTIIVNYITRWDGEKWNSMEGGITRTDNKTPYLKKIVRDGNLLYITGVFDLAGRGIVHNVAVWDIEKLMWVASPINIDGYVAALYIEGDDFYFGGRFRKAGDLEDANNIVKWNKRTNIWTKLADGISGTVSAITKWGDDIYLAGAFREASGVVCNSVAKYIPAEDKFEPLGSGITTINSPGRVTDMVVYKNELYLSGSFMTAGGTRQSSNMAKWSKAPVSVSEKTHNSDINLELSPNPADGILNIEILSEKQNYVSIEIYNLKGERMAVIYRGDIPAGKNYFYYNTVSNLTGTYIVLCRTYNGIVSKKAIIKR
jgi:hypothetical protein